MTRLVKAYREFLYVEDMAEAEACCYLMQYYEDESIINIGTGQDVSINALAEIIKDTVGYQGNIVFDSSKPDGTPKKVTDVTKLNSLGWQSKTSLRDGIEMTYDGYLNNLSTDVDTNETE